MHFYSYRIFFSNFAPLNFKFSTFNAACCTGISKSFKKKFTCKIRLSRHFVPVPSTYYSTLYFSVTSTQELCCIASFRVKILWNLSETSPESESALNFLPFLRLSPFFSLSILSAFRFNCFPLKNTTLKEA